MNYHHIFLLILNLYTTVILDFSYIYFAHSFVSNTYM